MSIFLLTYSPSEGRIISLEEFPDEQREPAHLKRLELELASASAQPPLEVVLLSAESLEDLKVSHGNYFDNLDQLVARLVKEDT